jgi:hypothetical protein
MDQPGTSRGSPATEALVDMEEWTLRASLPVYARPGIDTKPRSP